MAKKCGNHPLFLRIFLTFSFKCKGACGGDCEFEFCCVSDERFCHSKFGLHVLSACFFLCAIMVFSEQRHSLFGCKQNHGFKMKPWVKMLVSLLAGPSVAPTGRRMTINVWVNKHAVSFLQTKVGKSSLTLWLTLKTGRTASFSLASVRRRLPTRDVLSPSEGVSL